MLAPESSMLMTEAMLTQTLITRTGATESWALKSSSAEEYVVQIGFPRDWESRRYQPPEAPVPILYVTDGDSVFLTALEALHRHLCVRPPSSDQGVVVAIGYPLAPNSAFLMSSRRSRDLTPPADGATDYEGGADLFLDFIQQKVRPLVLRRLQETRCATAGREGLYGHSYGGLFSLHALFTRPEMFNCFIASSPSIWWNQEFILGEESKFREDDATKLTADARRSLMLFMGGEEQAPPKRRGEDEEEYKERARRYNEGRMIDNVLGMHERLKDSKKLEQLSVKVYEGEDHETVIGCSLSRGLVTFLEDWPLAT